MSPWLAPLVLVVLAACSEVAGVGANAALKSHQTLSGEQAEQAVAQRFAADPALAGLKVSVATANSWRDGFQTRTSVLMAGTVADTAAQARAVAIIRDTIGGDPAAVVVLDRSRIAGPASP